MDTLLLENTINSLIVTKPASIFETNKDVVAVVPNFSPGLGEDRNFSLLLIEDNAELAEFITTSLPNYKISRAIDRTDELQKIFSLMPALIMVDVGALTINSYEYCKRIKENERTNHIPVVLIIRELISDTLTEELALGADDYLFQPFSKEELCLRVKKLIIGQHYFQKAPSKELNSPVAPEKIISVPEDLSSKDPFLKKVYAVIEENFDNVNFDVAELAQQLFISKATLYRTLKAMCCPGPVNIITHYRLQRAAQYLIEGNSCSETADKTGFNTASYFSNCFRKLYKVSPHEFCRLGSKEQQE